MYTRLDLNKWPIINRHNKSIKNKKIIRQKENLFLSQIQMSLSKYKTSQFNVASKLFKVGNADGFYGFFLR